ncbi:uncharacterized protein LOC114223485 isoform X2 [Eumetopias jubatus]|uniref:uncharacterized protein LOC114223485 isoform X2 n=1 Tax=Eumetopias jubatus TaxID=34886 RepID=UPI0010167A86|nr:uncharacterized protein LOC114223485 isoform X2 [Eumetopias jubatus]
MRLREESQEWEVLSWKEPGRHALTDRGCIRAGGWSRGLAAPLNGCVTLDKSFSLSAGAEEAEQRYMMPLGASWVIPAHTPLTTKPVTRLCRHQWQELLLLLIASSDDLQPPPPETETTRSPTCNWKTVLEFVHLAVTISSLNQTCSLARRTLLQIWPSAQQGPVPGCAWHEIKLCDIVIVELHLIKAKVFLNTHVAGEKKLELCGGAEAGPGLGVGADVS